MSSCCSDEKWVAIKGFEPFYRISTCGRVQTCRVKGGAKPCAAGRIGPWKDLKQYLTKLHHGHRSLWIFLYKNEVKVSCYVHRLVLESFYGLVSSVNTVDHINHDSLDNHLSNLREATQAQNNINKKDKSSGIWFDKKRKSRPYRATIGYNKVKYELGHYDTYEEAYEARKAAEILYYGSFSNKLN